MDIVRAASGVTAGREWSRAAMDAFLSQWVVGGGCAHMRAGYWFNKRSRKAEVVLDPVTAPWTGTVFGGLIEIEVSVVLAAGISVLLLMQSQQCSRSNAQCLLCTDHIRLQPCFALPCSCLQHTKQKY
jgi:hypothetical protein